MTTGNDEQPAAENRDAANWAKTVSRLKVSQVPEGALNLNVDGRQLTSPIQGFGKMWQKTYLLRLPAERIGPTELIATWRKQFAEFWPTGNHFYAPLTGIEPGDVALLNLRMPGGTKLSTGVMVLYADEESFTLMTPQGHMFAGWITFSAARSQTLGNLAAHFGHPEVVVDTKVVCVDKRRQWSRWRNIWHSSAIRSTIYLLESPVRGARGLTHRKQSA